MITGTAGGMIEQLSRDAAHVWIVALDVPTETVRMMAGCLSASELERCERLDGDAARNRFIVARGAVRRILGHCTARDAGALTIVRTEHGKPRLDGGPALEFSVSHSRDIAVVAIAALPLGVDVEHLREVRHLDRTASRVLHHDTTKLLTALPEPQRTDAFIAAWTLREAHIKAVGGGLFRTPDTLPFDPSLPRDGRITEMHDRTGIETWSVARFRPTPGTDASLAARGSLRSLHIRDATETHTLITGGNE
jgi:4'-phosphopantetheinyl transferase